MSEVVTLGETMVCFSPGSAGPLRYISDYKMRFAGAESNLAIGLAKLGHTVAWISRLGEDEFGHYVYSHVQGEGVDCRAVRFDPARPTGLMFKQTGVGESKVYYYRAGSAASALCPEDITARQFAGAQIFSFSGITPLLSESCCEAVQAAVKEARRAGALVAFDPNIRKKLWKGPTSQRLMTDFLLDSEIVLAGLDELRLLLGVQTPEQAIERLRREGRAQWIALKDGANGAWAANRKECISVPPYPCRPVDPVGAGDAFNAAFLAGILEKQPLPACGRMGAVAGALATQTPGDIEGCPGRAELQAIFEGQTPVYR